ncbi:MAG: DUF1254 domain-containing protein, partial [Pseudomonadota bacterium]|nr:DUF1254 domain-containing protein [Pseudomonadota bacterium]
MKKITIIGLVALAAGALGLHAKSVMQMTAKAYLYAYPLVIMDETRAAMGSLNEGSTNRLYHNPVMPDHNFRSVVRPNNDTLYSIGWLDLTHSPVVLNVPHTKRYYVMPFMDAWTNVFATVGTRETGSDAGAYVVTGPDWQGELPSDLTRIEAPTNMVWMIGRIQVNGRDDVAAVKDLQQQFFLSPLEQWQKGQLQSSSSFATQEESAAQQSPMDTVEALNARDYFGRFNRLLAKQY